MTRVHRAEDERPEPLTLAEIAAEYGVPLWALRAALAESHPDASPAEVAARAREIAAGRYAHLMADYDHRPREIAAHLRDGHGIEPKAARKGYEREVWHSQHEYDGHPRGSPMTR